MPGDRIVVHRDPIVRFTVFLDRTRRPVPGGVGSGLQTSFFIRYLQILQTPVGRRGDCRGDRLPPSSRWSREPGSLAFETLAARHGDSHDVDRPDGRPPLHPEAGPAVRPDMVAGLRPAPTSAIDVDGNRVLWSARRSRRKGTSRGPGRSRRTGRLVPGRARRRRRILRRIALASPALLARAGDCPHAGPSAARGSRATSASSMPGPRDPIGPADHPARRLDPRLPAPIDPQPQGRRPRGLVVRRRGQGRTAGGVAFYDFPISATRAADPPRVAGPDRHAPILPLSPADPLQERRRPDRAGLGAVPDGQARRRARAGRERPSPSSTATSRWAVRSTSTSPCASMPPGSRARGLTHSPDRFRDWVKNDYRRPTAPTTRRRSPGPRPRHSR